MEPAQEPSQITVTGMLGEWDHVYPLCYTELEGCIKFFNLTPGARGG